MTQRYLEIVPCGHPCRLDDVGVWYFVHDTEKTVCIRLHCLEENRDYLVERLGTKQRQWWSGDTIVQPVKLEPVEKLDADRTDL